MARSRHVLSLPTFLGVLLVLAIACAPASQPSPTAAPAKPAATSAPAKPAEKAEAKPAEKAGAKPADKAAPAAQPAKPQGNPIQISAVTGWFREYVFNEGLFELAKRIEQKSGGNITITWRGGPEVAPAFEQVQPLKDGVFQMLNTSGAYYTQQVPEAVLLDYLDGPVSELRQAGVFDLFDQANQQRAGIKLLGLTTSNTPYHLFTKQPIQSLEDFRGKKMRGTPTYIPLIEALGASPVVMPASEIYAAMERGVVDGFAWPRMGIAEQKLQEVTCCVIDPGFWTVRTVLLMNMNTWNQLSPDQQQLLTSTVMEIEEEMGEQHGARSDQEIKELVNNHNMQVIRLPEDQARRYRELAYTKPFESWAQQMPEFTRKVEELAKKVSPAWPPMDYHKINL